MRVVARAPSRLLACNQIKSHPIESGRINSGRPPARRERPQCAPGPMVAIIVRLFCRRRRAAPRALSSCDVFIGRAFIWRRTSAPLIRRRLEATPRQQPESRAASSQPHPRAPIPRRSIFVTCQSQVSLINQASGRASERARNSLDGPQRRRLIVPSLVAVGRRAKEAAQRARPRRPAGQRAKPTKWPAR